VGSVDDRLTKVGLVVGTPAYVASELWHGGEADERSDIYAFGITLHVMLTGVTPFEGWSLPQLQAAHVTGKMPPLRLAPDAPSTPGLEAIMHRCITWSPNDRLQSVRELREMLLALHDPSAWTAADAEAFWKTVEKSRLA
jgi:serine/threonine-protein kinase